MSYNSEIASGVETNPITPRGNCVNSCSGTCETACGGGCGGGCTGTCSSCAYNCSGMGASTKIAPEVKF